MYRLTAAPEYIEDLRRIEAGAGHLAEILSRGAYMILERDPREGSYSETYRIWFIRQKVINGLLIVQIAYRIDEESQEVELVAIREIPTTNL